MKFLSNAHTHTSYCDGRHSIGEMLESAKRLGFVSIGFSGHGDQGFDEPYSMTEEGQEQYRHELEKWQMREADIRIWIGVEQDGMVSGEKKQRNRLLFDYIIGSTHYLCKDFHGCPVGVDGDMNLLKAYVDEVFAGDMMAMAKAYFEAHGKMILTDKPDVIGHFDLVRKHAEGSGLFNPQNPVYQKLALQALEQVADSGCILEVNTGGMARGYIRDAYPTNKLLAAWREMGGKITLTSDCHDAALLDYRFSETIAELKTLKYRSILRLGRGTQLWEEVEC